MLNIIKTKNLKLSKGGPVIKPILILTTGDVALPTLRDYFGKIEPFDTYVNDLPTNYSDDKDELDSDKSLIDTSNELGAVSGRFKKGNPYRFKSDSSKER